MALDPDTSRIIDFLAAIGIPVTLGDLPGETFLPGIAVRDGGLVLDPDRPFFPGDLLHEAGHVAVTEPRLRPTLNDVEDDPGAEMAAIAWSYAAARHLGIASRTLFHAHGYRGAGETLAAAFDQGAGPGAPLLQFYGMTAEPHQAERLGLPAYPQMARWLR